jgi:hypothetical protein
VRLFDKLPAWLQHLLIAFLAPYVGKIAADIVATGGVSTINWPHELLASLDLAAASAATIVLTLWVTPLTGQYGLRLYTKPALPPVQIPTWVPPARQASRPPAGYSQR